MPAFRAICGVAKPLGVALEPPVAQRQRGQHNEVQRGRCDQAAKNEVRLFLYLRGDPKGATMPSMGDASCVTWHPLEEEFDGTELGYDQDGSRDR